MIRLSTNYRLIASFSFLFCLMSSQIFAAKKLKPPAIEKCHLYQFYGWLTQNTGNEAEIRISNGSRLPYIVQLKVLDEVSQNAYDLRGKFVSARVQIEQTLPKKNHYKGDLLEIAGMKPLQPLYDPRVKFKSLGKASDCRLYASN